MQGIYVSQTKQGKRRFGRSNRIKQSKIHLDGRLLTCMNMHRVLLRGTQAAQPQARAALPAEQTILSGFVLAEPVFAAAHQGRCTNLPTRTFRTPLAAAKKNGSQAWGVISKRQAAEVERSIRDEVLSNHCRSAEGSQPKLWQGCTFPCSRRMWTGRNCPLPYRCRWLYRPSSFRHLR
jgi:hypothetical protein